MSDGIINGAWVCAHFFFLEILVGCIVLFVPLEFEGVTFSVWFDSLINFITSLKQSCDMLCLDFKLNIAIAADIFDVFVSPGRRVC